MRFCGRAAIALSMMFSVCASAFAQHPVSDGLLHVNAYDDRIEAARAEQRRVDAHREEAHREEARLEQERLAEARREARIDAYNAWLAHWHEMRSRDGMTP